MLKISRSSKREIYFFQEFLPGALAAFSTRSFEASRDLSVFLERVGARPGRFCTVEQVHGGKVLPVREPDPSGKPEADGLVTGEKGLALVIRTADCVPVFFRDPEAPAVGICHSGWRGAGKGIIFRMLDIFKTQFSSKPSSIGAAMGPSICRDCYEVGEEFREHFPGFVEEKSGKYFFNLKGALKRQLLEGGIPEHSIFISDLCTSCSVERFFSARREGPETGRFLSAIMLK